MASRRRPIRSRKRSVHSGIDKNTQAVIIATVATLLLGIFFASYFIKSKDVSHISHEEETAFCRTDILPEITAIVIDHTDKIDPIQKAALEKRLWDVADDVKKNGSLRFYSVDRTGEGALSPEFELCNPGSEEDVSDWDGNKRLARKRYEEKFSQIIKSKTDEILSADTAPQSPIMKSVQAAVVSSFTGGENNAPRKRLILVSDLLEHTNDFSLYNGSPDFESFRNGGRWPAVKSDMKGITVELFYLYRESQGHLISPQLKTFWQMYFLEQGAEEVRFVPIP